MFIIKGDRKFRRFLSQGVSIWLMCRLQRGKGETWSPVRKLSNPGGTRVVMVNCRVVVCILMAQLTRFVKGLDGGVRERQVKPASKVSGRIELPPAEMAKL